MRYLIISLFFVLSCSSKKDILFLQDLDNVESYDFNYESILVKPDDILKISIVSPSTELSDIFNFDSGRMANSLQNYQINGYQVDSEGFINLPLVGKLNVKDKNISQITNLINKSLVKNKILLSPKVDVKIVNAYFTILGEVRNPGRYIFLKNNMNILRAIGMAGDLTINGKRRGVKILRNYEDGFKVSTVDLTSPELLSSRNFQIFPGDIIIIEPNNSRVKNAGLVGNTGNLLSVLSFILSSLILITNN